MTSSYTTAQGSVTFTAAAESWNEQSDSDVGILAFPGGDAVAISLGGQRETRRTFKALLVNRAAYQTLLSMRNRRGGLFIENWDTVPVNAVLQRVAPDPIQADGQVYAQVQFVLY